MSRTGGCLGVALVLWGVLSASAAAAEIYRWTDESGTPHFSDRLDEVPARHRPQAADIQPGLRERVRVNVIQGLGSLTRDEDAAPASPQAEALAAFQQGRLAGGESLGATLGGLPATVLAGVLIGFLVAFAIGAALAALILVWACKICGEEGLGFGRGFGIASVQLLGCGAASILLGLLAGAQQQTLGFQAASASTSLLTSAAILRGMFCSSFSRSLVISVVTLVITVGISLALVFCVLCVGFGGAIAG